MSLPSWVEEFRRSEVVDRIRADPRSTDHSLLGVEFAVARRNVVGGGQADFEQPWKHLSPDDRALLYAYCNQLGHIEELLEAFSLLFRRGKPERPVLLDLGCGPFTAGLAFAAVLGPAAPFTYIGVDRAAAMTRLGETFAQAAEAAGALSGCDRHWVRELPALAWKEPPRWRPVVVVVSYLLASPTLDATTLVADVIATLAAIGRGPVTVLYTNSPRGKANRSFPVFQSALESAGFQLITSETGTVAGRRTGAPRELNYALFQRQSSKTLALTEE